MFIVLLRFSTARDQAGRLMQAHKDWLQRGFDDGVFVLAGSIQPQAGGMILAQGIASSALQARVEEDPFVSEGVVSAQILEVSPAKADPRLAFLLG